MLLVCILWLIHWPTVLYKRIPTYLIPGLPPGVGNISGRLFCVSVSTLLSLFLLVITQEEPNAHLLLLCGSHLPLKQDTCLFALQLCFIVRIIKYTTATWETKYHFILYWARLGICHKHQLCKYLWLSKLTNNDRRQIMLGINIPKPNPFNPFFWYDCFWSSLISINSRKIQIPYNTYLDEHWVSTKAFAESNGYALNEFTRYILKIEFS